MTTDRPAPLTAEELSALRVWFQSGEDGDYPFRNDDRNKSSRRSGSPTEVERRLLATLDTIRVTVRPAPGAGEAAELALERIFSAFDKSRNVPMFLASTIRDERAALAVADRGTVEAGRLDVERLAQALNAGRYTRSIASARGWANDIADRYDALSPATPEPEPSR